MLMMLIASSYCFARNKTSGFFDVLVAVAVIESYGS